MKDNTPAVRLEELTLKYCLQFIIENDKIESFRYYVDHFYDEK